MLLSLELAPSLPPCVCVCVIFTEPLWIRCLCQARPSTPDTLVPVLIGMVFDITIVHKLKFRTDRTLFIQSAVLYQFGPVMFFVLPFPSCTGSGLASGIILNGHVPESLFNVL